MNTRWARPTRMLGAVVLIAGLLVAYSTPSHAAATIVVPDDHPTIQGALDASSPGDEILVAPGSYTEYVDLGGRDVTVRSMAGPELTAVMAPNLVGNNRAPVTIGPGGAISGFSISSAHSEIYPAVAVIGAGSLIQGNIFDGRESGSIVGVDASPIVAGNVLTEISCGSGGAYPDAAIDLDGRTAAVVSNNLLLDLTGCIGIRLGTTLPGSRVVNNTLVDNERDGGILVFDSTNAEVRNNIVTGSDYGLGRSNGPTTAFTNNLAWENGSNYPGQPDPGAGGNLSADPQFMGSGPTPYALAPGSPAIDAATASGAPATAIDGAPRPLDGDGSTTAEFDIGAYEAGWERALVTGLVLSPDALPVAGVCAVFYDGGGPIGGAITGISGIFEAALDAGTYDIEFTDCGAGVYGAEWYNDSPNQAGATPVSAVSGATTTLLDTVLDNPLTLCRGVAPTQWGTDADEILTGGPGRDIILGFGGRDQIRAGDGDDVVCAGAGVDDVYGGGGADVIAGEGGNDQLSGDPGDDFIWGGSGNDEIYGQTGDDELTGGPGHDILWGYKGNNVLTGGPGRDLAEYSDRAGPIDVDLSAGTAVHGENMIDTISGVEDITGTAADDRIVGDNSPNVIDAGNGFDYVDGAGGDDILNAQQGTLIGGTGDDYLNIRTGGTVFPGPGNDTAIGGTVSYADATGPVIVNLRTGKATGSGTDDVASNRVIGSEFADLLIGNSEPNVIKGLGGNDTIEGRGRPDELYGGPGNDTIEGGDYDDLLKGGTGDDLIIGGPGWDRLYGQGGNDTLRGGGDKDKLWGGLGDDILEGGAGNDKLFGADGFDTAFGGGGVDRIFGGRDADTLNGGAGKDKMYGEGGRDTLNGGADHDLLVGGDHVDTLNGDEGDDVLDGGSANDTLNGGDDQDLLIGASGNDKLRGDSGHDTLAGVTGKDTLDGGPGLDTASFALSATGVTVDLNAGTATGEGGDSLLAIEWIVGSPLADRLTGDAGDNLIEAREGNDLVWAGAGSDLVWGLEGDDNLRGEAGPDFLDGGVGTDSLRGGSGSDSCMAGESNFSCEDIQPELLFDIVGASRNWQVPDRWNVRFAAL